MTAELLAGIWSTDGATMLESLDGPEYIGMRWTLNGFGLERLEMIVRCSSDEDQYYRYVDHHGKRLAVYSGWIYRPIAGFISEVRPIGLNRVLYIAKGPAWRTFTQRDTSVYDSTDTIDEVIKTVLTDHVGVADSDQSGIAANATAIGGWQPDYPTGSRPGDIFRALLDKSDASGNVYDIWFRDLPFDGIALGGWQVYYAARTSTPPSWPRTAVSDADWVVHREDVSRIEPSRDINNLITDVEILYGVITGTCETSPDDNYKLYDSGATFQTDGVKPGDRVINDTDGSIASVQRLEYNAPETTLYTTPLEGGTGNNWQNGDTYFIQRRDAFDSATDSVTAAYWPVKYAENRPEMNATQAAQYAAMLLNNEPTQNNPFTISAPTIKDNGRAEWPLWEVMAQAGGYVMLADLHPAFSKLDDFLNRETTFIITGLDYDHRRRSLSVEVDNPSRRLDARLRAAGILGSEMVART